MTAPDWKARIAKAGLTQAIVAERLGIKYGYFSNILCGHRPISADLAARLEKILRVYGA